MSKSEVPEAYRVGFVPFIHTKIYLDSHPLIPRPETEYWVNEVIKSLSYQLEARSSKLKVLDLCAGSGCIGTAILKDVLNSQVDFVELDEEHHETIRKNVLINGINPERARILGGNLFEKVSEKYDLILSNPPYIDMGFNRVEDSVLEHEPHRALDGGQKGIEIIERILEEAPKHLKPGSSLYLEHEPEQVEFLKKSPLYKATYKDQYGVERWSELRT